MSTRAIERELVDVLHRHAEDAMTGTDTHTEHERFREQIEIGPDNTPATGGPSVSLPRRR